MNNIFQIGGQVTGESFIGRKKIVESFRKKYIDSPNRICKAFIGLTRTGKTSFAVNLFKDMPDDIVYIYTDLNEWSTYEELWQDIIYQVEEYLEKHQLVTEELNKWFRKIEAGDVPWVIMVRLIKKIFSALYDMKLRTIMVLDEFDNARVLFSEGTKRYELFRTVFSDAHLNVSVLMIARRPLHEIEGTTYQSSTFHGVVESIRWKGFDEADMSEYFEVFAHEGVELTEEQKKEIVFYAGNAPFLLSILGYYILEAAEEGEIIDIGHIFLEKCKAINDYYRDCIEHLKRDDDVKRIVPFVIGPNIGVTKKDKDELFNLGYLREEDGSLVVISKYFTGFLSANMLEVSVWDNIIQVEKRLKVILSQELPALVRHYRAGGASVTDIQRSILQRVTGETPSDIKRYETFIVNNMKNFHMESNFFDVMSLTDVCKILRDCWSDIFTTYFDNAPLKEWDFKLSQCAKARNPVAHGHEEYLGETDRTEIDAYCKQLFDLLAKTGRMTEPPADAAVIAAAQEFGSGTSIPTASAAKATNPNMLVPQDDTLIGCRVALEVTEVGGAKLNNLRGKIDESHRGVIPKNYLVDAGNLNDYVGQTIHGTVEKFNSGYYEVRPDFF